ncbi:MAG: hypothetical protein IJ151_07685 [Bacteroidales bacterium]|nr:hypothetical protein [Bacteroidales bacterium]
MENKVMNKYEAPEIEALEIETEGCFCQSVTECTCNIGIGHGSGGSSGGGR